MIVVAIIGVLAAVALPAYQNYAARAKISEALIAATLCKTSVSDITQSAYTLPDAGEWGCETAAGGPASSQYVQSIETSAEGAVRVELRGISTLANGQAIILRPWPSAARTAAIAPGDAVGIWDCGPDPANTNDISTMVPGTCRAGSAQLEPLTAFAASPS
jgi:type IV pilus assembly protein PilA